MSLATTAIEHVLELLTGAGVAATRDPGLFTPAPIGVLVGLPTLDGRTLGGSSYSVPVTIVSGDPLSTPSSVDALYAAADAAADAVRADAYAPTSFSNGISAEPLPALVVVAQVTITNGG